MDETGTGDRPRDGDEPEVARELPGDEATGGRGAGLGGGPLTGATGVAADRERPARAAIAAASIVAIVLLIGVIVWLANRGGEQIESAAVTSPPAATSPTSVPATTAPDTTPSSVAPTTAPATTAATTSTPATTVPPTTAPPTTAPPSFALPGADATTWTVPLETGQEVTMDLAATENDIRVFDGEVDGMRCVGVVGPGDELTSWCGDPTETSTLTSLRGVEPVVVVLDSGDVDVAVLPSDWVLASSGCEAPLTSLLAAAAPGSHAVTRVVCADDEAFVGVGSSLFGPALAPDGGGVLVTSGDEGWVPVGGFGTSADCADLSDDVDRCQTFGVENDLFEALLPVPPPDVLGESARQVVQMTDVTDEVRSWIGGTTDPDDIVRIVSDELVEPDAEVPASVRRSGPLGFGRLELLVVEVPQLDDAFGFDTSAVWIDLDEPGSGVTGAYRWATCRRGITGDGLCV